MIALLQGWLDRAADALTDQARRGRAMALFLVAYTLVWTLYGVIAKSSQDLHVDMTEIFDWSRELSHGYAKHPPLAPYIVRFWFSFFPAADWAYYLLAMAIAALTLWIAWRAALRYLDPQKAVAATLLLTLIPFFNFHALKFNANTVLMPAWAATTLFFLISYETRSRWYAVLAGIAAAAAMLGKYWSIFLLVGLVAAAMIDRRRGVYFRSAAPYFTIAAGALTLAPHVLWLFTNDFAPFRYATALHGEKLFAETAVSSLGYLGGALGYVVLPLIVVGLLAAPRGAALRDTLVPRTTDRRLVAFVFWLPLLLPAVIAPLGGLALNSLWSMPAFTSFGIVALSSPLIAITQRAVSALLATAIVTSLLFLAASPLIAYGIHRKSSDPWQTQTSLLTPAVEELWRETTDAPLRYVCGDAGLSFGVRFYSAARPLDCEHPGHFLRGALPPDPGMVRDGFVVVCLAGPACDAIIDAQRGRVPATAVRALKFARTFMGQTGPAARYRIAAVPPTK